MQQHFIQVDRRFELFRIDVSMRSQCQILFEERRREPRTFKRETSINVMIIIAIVLLVFLFFYEIYPRLFVVSFCFPFCQF